MRKHRDAYAAENAWMHSLYCLFFYKLDGKKVLVAGGSDAAAWKAELLAASGAHVHIFAEELDPFFEELIAEPRH